MKKIQKVTLSNPPLLQRRLAIAAFFFLLAFPVFSQKSDFTRQDTLRGSITPERSWWDLTHYELSVSVNPADSTILGRNDIHYKVLRASQVMQVDLQAPMKITKVMQGDKVLKFKSVGNAHFIHMKQKQSLHATGKLTVFFE